jgi:endonuclease/exonuclease/phosphatase family metal-dependent hydrolase
MCLQEVYDAPEWVARDHRVTKVCLDLLSRIRDVVPHYRILFVPNSMGVTVDGRLVGPEEVRYGNALLVRDDLGIEQYRVYPIVARPYVPGGPADGRGFARYVHTLQVVVLRVGECIIKIGNFHGLPSPGDKLDTPARLFQSMRLLDKARDVDVLCGDFNLDPDTTSIAMLEAHWRNLIREFAVPSTRSRLNPYRGTPQEQRFADYAFVSDAIEANRFGALDAQVSDHLGLLLEARIKASVPSGAPKPVSAVATLAGC